MKNLNLDWNERYQLFVISLKSDSNHDKIVNDFLLKDINGLNFVGKMCQIMTMNYLNDGGQEARSGLSM